MDAIVFDTVEAAEKAQADFAIAMGLGKPGNGTTRWDNPAETVDGKFAIVPPETKYLSKTSFIPVKTIFKREADIQALSEKSK
jgi:hypothetical protein